MSLKEIIQQLIKSADADREKWHSKRLGRGMTIHVKHDITAYKLVLARTDTHPSAQEWKTVSKFWPHQIAEPHFAPDQKDGRYFLKGKVPLNEQGQFI